MGTAIGPFNPATLASIAVFSVTANGSVFANDATIGTIDWANPGNAVTPDHVRATVDMLEGVSSHYLKATGFGFAIPTGVTILGITVDVRRSGANGSDSQDAGIRLVRAGTIEATDKKTGDLWNIFDDYAAYGGAADLWGAAWTAEDINSSTFGVVVAGQINFSPGGTVRLNVDHIRITVTYASTGVAWTNPANAGASDDARATAILTATQVTQYLKATAFGFQVPLDAIITGVLAEIEGNAGLATVEDNSLKLVIQDVIGVGGAADLASATVWPSADAYRSYGGDGNIWGQTVGLSTSELTPVSVNRSDFGVALAVHCTVLGTIAIDHIRLTVFYQGSNRFGSQAGLRRINAGGMGQSDFVS